MAIAQVGRTDSEWIITAELAL